HAVAFTGWSPSERQRPHLELRNDVERCLPRVRGRSLSLRASGASDALFAGRRCCVGEGHRCWLQSRVANRGSVLGRPLRRSGGPLRVRMGNRNTPGGPDRRRNRGPAKEGVRWRPALSSLKAISSEWVGRADRNFTKLQDPSISKAELACRLLIGRNSLRRI